MKKRILGISALISFALGAAHAQAPVTAEFVMANNDLNKDGVISHDEANKAGRQLAQTWAFFDTNQDEKVTMEELKAGLAARAQQTAATPPAATPPAASTPAKTPAATPPKPSTSKAPATATPAR
jgi:hypothetical protein